VPLSALLGPADALLVGCNQHRRYALAGAWEALLNLGLSISLARRLGVGGVALGTALARIGGAGPVMLWEARRVISRRTGEP
jgi:O-antigen/teichoic acid export membrane protein